MIGHLLLSAGLAPLLGVAALYLLVDRLRPAVATVACTGVAVVLALSSTVTVLTAAGHAVTQVTGPHRVGWASWLALVLLVGGAGAVIRSATRQAAGLRSARREAAGLPGRDCLVVVEDARPAAFTLPGRPGRIVVTDGLLAALGPAERAAVVAHERAHLTGAHHRWLLGVRLAAAANPLLRPVTALVAYTVERWADERAAEEAGGRAAVARAIGLVALAGPAPARQRTGRLHLSVAGWSVPRPGPVPRRIAALLRPAPGGRHIALLAAPALVVAGSCFWTGEAIVDLGQFVRLSRPQSR
ncbi:M56 family metallopeptidase [Polymorphospora rubra]|uniref:M56 family metallopeptidase n=1 Tax=Polymorphospora rubra TaxID=338584 RepID=UPI0033F1A0F0